MRAKRVALEFTEEKDYQAALGLLDDVEGQWALPDRMVIIIELRDLPIFEAALLSFDKVPVVPASQLSAKERADLRARR